VHRSQ